MSAIADKRPDVVELLGVESQTEETLPRSRSTYEIIREASREIVAKSKRSCVGRTKSQICSCVCRGVTKIFTHPAGRISLFAVSWFIAAAMFRYIEGGYSPLDIDKIPDPRQDIVDIIHNVTIEHGWNETLLRQELRVALGHYEAKLRHALMYGVDSNEANVWDWVGSFLYVATVFTTIGGLTCRWVNARKT